MTFVHFELPKTGMEFFLFRLPEISPKLLDNMIRFTLRAVCINSVSYSYPSLMLLSLSNHKSNSSDMADNINDLSDALSMMKGIRFIISTKIQIEKNIAICHAPVSPRIKKDEIKNIILGGGQNLLSPERRFDAILVNSPDLFE